MAVITLSRQMGSTGEVVARGLAERFGFALIDRAGLEDLVLSYGLDEGDLGQLQERAPSLRQRLFSDRKLYLELVASCITDLAERENFILLGRGGQCLFRDRADAFHVRLIASEAFRVEQLLAGNGLSREAAQRRLSVGEREQKRFIRYLYGEDIDHPLLYDLVLRTDHLDALACVQVIVQAVGQRSLPVHVPGEATREAPGPMANPSAPKAAEAGFANSSEEALAKILNFYQIRYEYEPKTFPLAWDAEGRVTEAFSPDFYLVDSDLYIELTTLRQSLVTKKNRKLRRMKEMYPDVNVRMFYRKDFQNLLIKYGLIQKEGAS